MHVWLRLVLILLVLWPAGSLAAQPAAPAGITATAPLGTTTTATLTLDNTGKPAATVQLYEAWPASQAGRPQASQPIRVTLPDSPARIDPQLQQTLAAAPDRPVEMIVYLADQADLSQASQIADWNERGRAVYETLRQHAAASQADLRARLVGRGYAPRSLWIVNALLVSGDGSLADLLAAEPAVGVVTANTAYALDIGQPVAAAADQPATWGLDRIRAPLVWGDWGVKGQGIIVANIDTGVYITHTALLQGYRGWSPGGLSHDYNWFDPTARPYTSPNDPVGHGTHTMGTIAGRAAASEMAIGVAPAARWIAARGCISTLCENSDLIESAQWMLAPTLANCQPDLMNDCAPRPDLRPHIINNSWGSNSQDEWYRGYVQAWNAAGILSVFSNGNAGRNGCNTAATPARYSDAFAVGATDSADLIAAFSSRGASTYPTIKPDLSAPGVAVASAWLNGGLSELQGTSMAAPHVAGAAALLWSVNPTLIGDLGRTQDLLRGNSAPIYSSECGESATARPNSVYGWGRLDAYAAVQKVRIDVPWMSLPASVNLPANGSANVTVTFDGRQVPAPGSYAARVLVGRQGTLSGVPASFNVTAATNTAPLTGRVVDRWSGNGIYATLQFNSGLSVNTDYSGSYTVTLPYGAYPLTAKATGYIASGGSVAIPTQSTAVLTLTPDIPHMVIAAPVLSATLAFGERSSTSFTVQNTGTRALKISADVPPAEWSVEDSAAGGAGAQLYPMDSFPALVLQDDEVYSQTVDFGFSLPVYGGYADRGYVSSNGWISTEYQRSAAASSTCFPTQSLPPGTLAPFWADLDPSQGGAIRAGRFNADTFVVSYEEVPLWQDPSITMTLAPTYTFQISLHSDGRVQYHYGEMTRLPSRWSIGASYGLNRGQAIACAPQSTALGGRTWTLRNQASAQLWLYGPSATVTIPPQSSAVLTGMLRGFGHTPWRSQPAEGVLRLLTNDPRRSVVHIPGFVQVGAPPYRQFYPIMLH
jgi:subtilisin family serine protease